MFVCSCFFMCIRFIINRFVVNVSVLFTCVCEYRLFVWFVLLSCYDVVLLLFFVGVGVLLVVGLLC